jgi:hypothetical protein
MTERAIDEPCLSCGDETATGSVLYPGRHDLKLGDGGRGYLCDECYAKARAAKGGESTDADLAKNGGAMAAGFYPSGGRPGITRP